MPGTRHATVRTPERATVDFAHGRPGELPGSRQQQGESARALAPCPAVVFADEPTGNPDSRSGAEALRLLREAVRSLGRTVVVVAHGPRADGPVADQLDSPTAESVARTLRRLEDAG